jgi:hypothetical protein
MSSNSIRIGAGIFDSAREEGALMSRSAAQQIEHWARLGAALEASGLTVVQLAQLLQTGSEHGARAGDANLWEFKRARQRADFEQAAAGLLSQDQLSWFPGDKARDLKLPDSPY